MVQIPTKNNPEPPPGPFDTQGPRRPSGNDVEDNKTIAALSYLWVVSLVVLLSKKDSPFAQFHAKQGLVLFLASIIIWFIGSFVPFGGLLNLVVLAFSIWGFISALQGQHKRLPLVYDITKKLNL